jgi:uncharacterized membrane protein
MRWLTWHRLHGYLRNSAWPVPTLAIPLALIVSPLIREFDEWTRWRGADYSIDGARALLAALAPATLTFIALILSTLLLIVQLASAQFSPRLIGGLLADRPVKCCLFVFVFSYVYCVGALGRVDTRVPQLPVLIAMLSTLFSVSAGLFLIDYMARELRPVRMLSRTANVGRSVIEQVYPRLIDGGYDPPPSETVPSSPASGPCQTILRTGQSQFLLAMDLRGILALAQRSRCMIEVIPRVGDFVDKRDPLFRVYGEAAALPIRQLRKSMEFGNERTLHQDPAFVFRILVDVACKALSPAINDPTTAVLAIDQIHHLLRLLGMRRLDTGEVRDANGNLRVKYRTPDWDDFVLLAVTEIRQYGGDSIQVARRLRAMLENLVAAVPPSRAAILTGQLWLLNSSIERSFEDAEDRVRAGTGDYQGVGSSRNGDPQPQVDHQTSPQSKRA